MLNKATIIVEFSVGILTMAPTHPALRRALTFAQTYQFEVPILLAPMAGVSPPSLSIAVAHAGGLGSCGALLMPAAAIQTWADDVRSAGVEQFQINLWIPDPPTPPDDAAEAAIQDFLRPWNTGNTDKPRLGSLPDFTAQCEMLLTLAPPIISSVMGLYPPDIVARMKAKKIAWFATVTTVAEAQAAAAAGADAVIAQGMEAGGHRGAFDASYAETQMVGLFALIPAVVDAVALPVIATGGIADPRGVAAALLLGASAVQIGTGFLRCPEAQIPTAWANALSLCQPEDTRVTRAFSGRPGRSLATSYVRSAAAPHAPPPAPYPQQRALTQAMRDTANIKNDLTRMQAWAGQASRLAQARPAGEIVHDLWEGACAYLA